VISSVGKLQLSAPLSFFLTYDASVCGLNLSSSILVVDLDVVLPTCKSF